MTGYQGPRITSGETDVTESVQIMYDCLIASMDWGSGFLDNEEVEAVVGFAVTMGWQVPGLDNSEPMATVAQKFPDHYDIQWVEQPTYRGTYTTTPTGKVVVVPGVRRVPRIYRKDRS